MFPQPAPVIFRLSATRDKVQNLLGEGDDDTAGEGQKAVCPLRRVVRFKRKTDLHDTKGEQDKTDCSNQAENKIGQITDHG